MSRPDLDGLASRLGGDALRTDAETLSSHGRDWTRYFEPAPSAVVFPRTADEVVSIIHWARETGTALVPSGGRTGLSGGAVARSGEVVVSFDRMNHIGEVDEDGRLLDVGPGAVTEAVQQKAVDAGYFFPVDFASRGSSQIGGNIATNAGGIKVLRYGLMRDWVAGLDVVTGSGERMSLNRGLVKNATGYDLRQLFIGSEGTLGFITGATLRVTETPKELSVVVLALDSIDSVMPVFHAFRRSTALTAFEYFSDRCLRLVESRGHVSAPFEARSAAYVLAEIEHVSAEATEQIEVVFGECMEAGHVVDGVISQSGTQAKELWRLREDISEAATPFTPYKNDVSVTISRVPEFIRELGGILEREYPELEVLWFGHVGDGNLHINVLKPDSVAATEFYKSCQRVDELVFATVARMQGSVSAEHGVGLIKKPFLGHSRSAAEIDYMRAIKRVFDPDGIMNPGKIFDAS